LGILLVLLNSNRSTGDLFAFMILLTTSAILFVYLAGTAAAWRYCASPATRVILCLATLFIAFAFWGAGFEADAWCLALLAVGVIVYAVMRVVNSRLASPAAAEPAT